MLKQNKTKDTKVTQQNMGAMRTTLNKRVTSNFAQSKNRQEMFTTGISDNQNNNNSED